MRTTLAVALALALSQTAVAALFTPGPPNVHDPENYFGLLFDIQPPPQRFELAALPGQNPVINNSVYPSRPSGPSDIFGGLLPVYLFTMQPNSLNLNFRPEGENRAIGVYNVSVRTPEGQPLVRNVSVTAPGYSRSFQAVFVPEPSGLFLLLGAMAVVGMANTRN